MTCTAENIPQETVERIGEVLAEDYKVTLTSGNIFSVPVRFEVFYKGDYTDYWYKVSTFPFGEDYRTYLYEYRLNVDKKIL